MKLTSLAFLSTTHARADGNHQLPAALLSPAFSFAVVGRREIVREGWRIDLSPRWKAVSLTSAQGPISFLTLRSQSALPLNVGNHCVLGRNTASLYVFRLRGLDPG